MDSIAEKRMDGSGKTLGKTDTKDGQRRLLLLFPSTPTSPGPVIPRALRRARQGSGQSIRMWMTKKLNAPKSVSDPKETSLTPKRSVLRQGVPVFLNHFYLNLHARMRKECIREQKITKTNNVHSFQLWWNPYSPHCPAREPPWSLQSGVALHCRHERVRCHVPTTQLASLSHSQPALERRMQTRSSPGSHPKLSRYRKFFHHFLVLTGLKTSRLSSHRPNYLMAP